VTQDRQYRCRFCGHRLPAWLPAAQAPDGGLLLGHLSQQHHGEVRAYLDRMQTSEDIAPVAMGAFERVRDDPAIR
jgi:hypothetical protein